MKLINASFLLICIASLCYSFTVNLFERKLTKLELQLAHEILKVLTPSLSPSCTQALLHSFNSSDTRDLFLTKVFQDSGKFFNDLGSYSDCFHKRYKLSLNSTTAQIEPNLTFIIYSIKSERKELFAQSKLIGACLPIGCLESEYVALFRVFSSLIQIDSINEDTVIRAYDIKDGATRRSLQLDKQSNNYIPFYLLLFILSLSFIPKIIAKVVKWSYFSSKRKSNSGLSQSSSSSFDSSVRRAETYKRKLLPRFVVYLRKLKSCFDISDNASEIKQMKITMHDVPIINDIGLSFTSGLRGIAMVFIVIGLIFEHLNDSPVKLLHFKRMLHFLQSLSFSFVLFCKRFGIQLGYSISGLSLTYKLLCYLDTELTKLESIALNEEIEDSIDCKQGSIEELAKLPPLSDLLIDDESNKYPAFRRKLKLSSLIYFHSRQLYKYILFIVFALFFKYSYWIVIAKMVDITPMWIYMKEEVINLFTFPNLLSTIFLYDLYIPDRKFPKNPFTAVINEVSYFLFGSMLLFYFYKQNYRLDKFILYVCGLFSVMKLILFFTLFFQRDRIKKYFPAKNFTDNYYSFIKKNSLYNTPIFLTGVFFGLVNYSYQKSIEMSYSKATKTNKKMLILPMKFISFFQGLTKSKKRLSATLSIVSFVGTVFSFYIVYNYLFPLDDKRPEDFFENVYANVYFLFDIDIAVWLVYLTIFPLCFYGDNFFIDFLKHDYWTYASRPYFVFLLIANMVIYFIFYRSDSKIQIDCVNVTFFGLLAVLILFILNTLFFIFYDLPLKKLSKTVIYSYDQSNDDAAYSKQMGLKLSVLTRSNGNGTE